MRQGFEIADRLSASFVLHVKRKAAENSLPRFRAHLLSGEYPDKENLVAYYSNRYPFAEYYVNAELNETAARQKLSMKVIRHNTAAQAQSAPTPATLISLFGNGKIITTDLSVCFDNRLDRIVGN